MKLLPPFEAEETTQFQSCHEYLYCSQRVTPLKNKRVYVESQWLLICVIPDAVLGCCAGLELGLNTSVKACPMKLIWWWIISMTQCKWTSWITIYGALTIADTDTSKDEVQKKKMCKIGSLKWKQRRLKYVMLFTLIFLFFFKGKLLLFFFLSSSNNCTDRIGNWNWKWIKAAAFLILTSIKVVQKACISMCLLSAHWGISASASLLHLSLSVPLSVIPSTSLSLCELHLSPRHGTVCVTQAMWVSFSQGVWSSQG